jgi:hypothetical protein
MLNMKLFITFLIISLLFIVSCETGTDTLPSASKIGSISSNDLNVDMYLFPPPEYIKLTDSMSLKFIFTNKGKTPISGTISVEDTPDNAQFGGILEPAETNFLVDTNKDGKNNIVQVVVPGTEFISYSNGLNLTSFNAIINYGVQKELTSSQFCLKSSDSTNVNKCSSKGTVTTGESPVNSITYEYLDSNADNIIDKMVLKFDFNDKCEIITTNEQLIQNSEVYLKNAASYFDCSIDKSQGDNVNTKKITCINRDDLNINTNNPYYQESIVVKFKYDCKLLLDSGFINFNKGG